MTERKRATGFSLMDAAFAADAKFQRLLLRAESRHDYAAAVGVYWLLLADCRRGKSPVIDWEDYEEYDLEIGQLQGVHLLDEHGFEPEVFERWAPAYRSVPKRTPDTEGDGEVRTDTKSTLASGQVNSGQVTSPTNANGHAREKPKSFIRWEPPAPKPLTPDEIESYRRTATTGLDPLVKANARQALEKAGISVESP